MNKINNLISYCDEVEVCSAQKDDGVILDFKYQTDNKGRVRETFIRIYLPRIVFNELKKQ